MSLHETVLVGALPLSLTNREGLDLFLFCFEIFNNGLTSDPFTKQAQEKTNVSQLNNLTD